ncbi:uncharacterized protein MEPE_01862 [Melanopsichium pennsylvanicum]|uniref:sn-1-specific diacylglycerol lipase n=2 Tax=Melanopsichium pennsylvanicum TaxID=63383 RepID=A0AAJ4XJW2_9BASI|nr:alpha beta-hydrolase [Melanopsichium pennsylvanicum 4]SNX83156.1 uncharacterized protein MEPE_01862 [Melanopsichium pennsylvanicum]
MSGLPPGSFVDNEAQHEPVTTTTEAPSITTATTESTAEATNTSDITLQVLHINVPHAGSSAQALSPEEAKEAKEEREEAVSLNEAALSIPDSEANLDNDAESMSEPANEAVPGQPGVVATTRSAVDWNGVLGHTGSGLGAANAATSAYFSFARTATAFGLNVAKRVTQGLVAVPALLADGALTGTAPGDTTNPSIARVAHSGIANFFDTISTLAVGGIDLTSAVTSAGLGAAGSGVEGVRRALGSEVLRSLTEFSKLVKREWTAQDDSLPPGGIPAYSIVGITKALTTWVSIQLVTRSFQEKRMLQSLLEIDTHKLKDEVEALKASHHVEATSAPLVPITHGAQAETETQNNSEVRITSNQTLTGGFSGNVIGAEIGRKDGSSARLPGSTLSDEPARPLSDAEAVHNLQRYSKLVLGVYGGMALYWLNSMPSGSQTSIGDNTAANPVGGSIENGGVIFNAEEVFMAKDQAEFLQAAREMELEDEEEELPTGISAPSTGGAVVEKSNEKGHASSYNLWDVISGTHDEDLFHHTANLERGAAAPGQYVEDQNQSYNPNDKAKPSKPRFYVVTDHPRKTIILVLRGTLTVGDVAADLTCESVPFTFDPEVQRNIDTSTAATTAAKLRRFVEEAHGDLCHEGMLITATEIGAPGRSVHRSVATALASNPGYSIDITGHSLGAGVASVLAMLWADPTTGLTTRSSGLPPGRRLHAYCFAVPCVTSSDLGRKVSSIITSFTYSYDLVCRLSLGSIQDIRNCAAWLCYQDKEAGHVGEQNMNGLMKRAFEYQSGRMEEGRMREVEQEVLVLRKTLEANMRYTHLFPPGKVLYALTEVDDLLEVRGEEGQAELRGAEGKGEKRQRLFRVKDDDKEALKNVFGQIIFSRNMLSCHMPNVYDGRLHDLIR